MNKMPRQTSNEPLCEGWKDSAYWLDGLPPAPTIPDLPLRKVDIAIIGSGYTGLNAAIQTARAGRSTLVLDAENPGWGCSTRNGGQISTSIKPSLQRLTNRFGAARGCAIRQEGESALDWIGAFVARENLDCAFTRCGRYHAAHTPAHYEVIAREAEIISHTEGVQAHAVPRSEQHNELGSDAYFGGVVFPRHAALDPALYHRGLLDLALTAGVHVTGHCTVQGLERQHTGFLLTTAKGPVQAREVLVATNGYTGHPSPWLRRRVIPIGSYVIATEPIAPDLMDRLFPTNRIASDTCKVVYYYRPSPDRTRILFGGRVSAGETNAAISGPRLYQDMCRIFPELADYAITHSWAGQVAYTFDELAHTGVHDGVHYAMGYCGSGVSMASYLGMRAGQKMLGLKDGRTAFDDLPFPTRPLYTGRPWFLPATVAWYRWRDRMQWRRAQAM